MKHLSSGLRVGLAMVVCAAVLVPSALADNGKKPDGPGNSANAPGHNKDADASPPQAAASESDAPEPTPPPAPPESGPAPSAAPPAEAKQQESPPAALAPQASNTTDRERPEHPEKPKKPDAKPQPVSGGEPSSSSGESMAHRKVLICHATGSATNPYVLISVSVNAWSGGHGHGGHARDVFIDWSWPGDPRQKNDALCPSTGGVDAPPTTTTSTSSSTTVPSSSAPGDPGSRGESAVGDPSVPTRARPQRRPPTMAPPATAVKHAVVVASGQLAQTAVRGQLPFTGLPLWSVALVGLVLVAGGLALRRRSIGSSPA